MSRSKQREGAKRLFEALSGVDEELLARSEEKKERQMPRFPAKWTRNLAVCASFAACGLILIYVSDVFGAPKSGSYTDNAAPESGAPQSAPAVGGDSGWSVAEDTLDRKEGTGGADWNGQGTGEPEEAEADNYSAEKADEKTRESAADISTDGAQEELQSSASASMEKESVTMENCVGLPLAEEQALTLEEAKAVDTLGGYIPSAIPTGYQLESARYREADKRLFLSWLNGMDYITLQIRLPGETEIAGIQLTDIAEAETYDVSLYEIPYGETVPPDIREQFLEPVFAAGSLSQAVVEARMKTVQDAGDTGTPRGNFDVLYDSGVLVCFNGKATAADVWAMFQSISP